VLEPTERRPLQTPRLVACTSLAVFTLVAVAVAASTRVEAWDAGVNRWVGEGQPHLIADVAVGATAAGGGAALLIVSLAAAVLLLRLGRVTDAVLIALVCPLTQVATSLLKLAFERPRPPVRAAELDVSTYAFPSGHASVSMAVYGALALIVLRHSRRLSPATVLVPAGALILAVALSRIALGAHYPTDVVAGLALGAACLSGCAAAAQRLRFA
jgi:undecaprenyl-diphosphatase